MKTTRLLAAAIALAALYSAWGTSPAQAQHHGGEIRRGAASPSARAAARTRYRTLRTRRLLSRRPYRATDQFINRIATRRYVRVGQFSSRNAAIHHIRRQFPVHQIRRFRRTPTYSGRLFRRRGFH